jgi:iron complex outermembrane receptor protein
MRRFAFMAVLFFGVVLFAASAGAQTVTNTYTGTGDALTFPATMDNGAAITYGADTITFDSGSYDATTPTFAPLVNQVDLPTDGTMGNGDFEYIVDLGMTDLDGVAGWFGQGIKVSFGDGTDNSMSIAWKQHATDMNTGSGESKCVEVNTFDDSLGIPEYTGWTQSAEICGLEGAGAGAISLGLALAGNTLTASYKPAGGAWTVADTVDMAVAGPDPTSEWTLSVFNWGVAAVTFAATSHVVDEFSVTFTPAGAAVDTIAPVITLLGAEIIYLDKGDTYADPGATATDNEDGDLTSAIVVGGDTVAANSVGAYEVTYDVEDAAGNAATTVTRWVIVDPVVGDDTDSCFVDSASAHSRQRPFPLVLVALFASILFFLCGRMPQKKESKQMKKIQISLIALLLVIGLVAGNSPSALAQEAEEEKGVFVLEEIVVTSQRREQNVQDVPVSMTAMSGEDLEKLHLETTTQLSAQVANLNMDNGSGENTFIVVVIRGVTSMGNTSAAGQAALIYSDDLLLDSYYSHGFAFFDVDRVEVLRGPQGTLFGRNSTSGAIQVISDRPGDELEGYAELTYGRYNRTRFEGAVGGPISDKVGLRLAALYDRKDGWYENIRTHDDLYNSDVFAVRGILEFEPTDDIDILLKAQYGSVDQDPLVAASSVPNPHLWTVPNNPDPLVPFAPSLAPLLYNPGPASDYTKANLSFGEGELEDDVEDYQFTLTLNWDLGDMRLTSVTGYTELTYLHVYDWDSTAAAIMHAFNDIEYNGFIQELRLTSEGESAFQWIAGGFFLNADIYDATATDYTDYYGASGFLAPEGFGWAEMGISDHDVKSYGVFAHTTYAWAEKLATTHAIRYTRDEMDRVRSAYNFTTFPLTSNRSYTNISAHTDAGSTVAHEGYSDEGSSEEITWRLAVEYAARDDLLLYASVSRGYKVGVLGGVWVPDDEDPTDGSYPFIEPETVIAYETGIKSRWLDNRLLVNGAVFYYDYENYQTVTLVDKTPSVDEWTDASVPQVKFAGYELEIVAQPIKNLLVSLGLGYVDNEIEEYVPGAVDDLTGNKTSYTPEMDFNGLIRYDIPVPGFGVLTPQFDWDYIGESYSTMENVRKTGDDWIYNARLTYRNDRGLSINLFVENIADEKHINSVYTAYAKDIGTDIMTHDNPRTYGITIRYDF